VSRCELRIRCDGLRDPPRRSGAGALTDMYCITPGTTIYTVGHSTRSAEELEALLREAGIELLVDVRAFPSSRRHPQFNRGELATWLPAAGIAYRHMPALGGRRTPAPGSPNGGWREAAFQGYADHMRSPEFGRALSELEAGARQMPTAIMCAEAVWWRCHRRLIADALVARGWRVEHLGVGDVRAAHELPEFAVVGPDRSLTYPPAQGSLFPGGDGRVTSAGEHDSD
jgi:hypothetical protein